MAAGQSTRMYPITLLQPKPLVRIANKPILAHQLDQLVGLVNEVIIIVGYKSKMIQEAFGYSYRNIAIGYVEQEEQLGTGDAAMQASPYIKDRFLLMNGDDLYARQDIEACLQYDYALLGKEVPDVRLFSELVVQDGLVKNIIEKPKTPTGNLTSVGMFLLDKKLFGILETIPKSPRGEYELPDAIVRLTQMLEIHCHVVKGYWLPVGYPWHVLNTNDFLLENFFEEAPSKGTIASDVTVEGRLTLGDHSQIHPGTHIQGNVIIGRNCVIGPNCSITGNTAIGDHTIIGPCVVVENSVIDRHCRIDAFVLLSHSVIGEHVTIGSGTVTMSDPLKTNTVTSVIKGQTVAADRQKFGVTVGNKVVIQPHVVTLPGVKIGPEKTVPAGKVLRKDLM